MIRTCDPLIRSQVLYPTELRVRVGGVNTKVQRPDGQTWLSTNL
jgi:hypothetical protein